MNEKAFRRKLTTILSADVVAYSRLMGDDEEATVRTLTEHRGMISALVGKHGGRVVDSPGDNILAEFASVVDGVRCGVEMQRELELKNEDLPRHRRMEFRVGINLGDVIVDEDRIYGDGVNIAARLEGLAERGGICISGTVFDQIEGKLDLHFDYLGEKAVKNIAKPVRVYRVGQGEASVSPTEPRKVEPARRPSIAVLPFTNMSGDPDQEYFSDGITEDIITGLSKVPGLLVIARNSTFVYKGKAVKVQEVGRELGVRYVLEGSVRKAGERVRITAQLIDAGSGHHLWAERYDRKVSDIFAIQDEITVEIMRAMQVKLTEGEQACEWLKHGSQNIEAYEKGMKGMACFRRFSHEGNVDARRLFEECLRLDPEYAGAYVMLGWSHLLDIWNGWSRSPMDSLNQAFQLAQKALTLDASQADAYALLGNIYLFQREFDKAVEEAERAIVLNPNGADHHVWLAMILSAAGRPREGVDYINRALRLNPLPPGWYFWSLGDAYGMLERYEEAVEAYSKALENSPDMFFAMVGLAATYAGLGSESEARATAAKILEIDPGFSVDGFAEALPYKLEADRVRLAEALRKAGLK
jgi:adenylate cyclase